MRRVELVTGATRCRPVRRINTMNSIRQSHFWIEGEGNVSDRLIDRRSPPRVDSWSGHDDGHQRLCRPGSVDQEHKRCAHRSERYEKPTRLDYEFPQRAADHEA